MVHLLYHKSYQCQGLDFDSLGIFYWSFVAFLQHFFNLFEHFLHFWLELFYESIKCVIEGPFYLALNPLLKLSLGISEWSGGDRQSDKCSNNTKCS